MQDLVDAHILALNHLRNTNESGSFNLGNGNGFSVREVIEVVREVTGHSIPVVVSPRREGDPESLVASSEKAQQMFGWKTPYSDLHQMVKSAWEWYKKNPTGYQA